MARIIDAYRFASEVAAGEHGKDPSPEQVIRSPWTAGSLAKIAYADMFGGKANVVTRADAMKVPQVVKGRALICGTLSRQPLAKFRGGERIEAEPWMYRTSSDVPPQSRMLWTLDDLIFHGSSLWAVERGTRDHITDAIRVPHEWWEIDQDTLQVLVNGQSVDADAVVLIEGPQDGLLDIAADDIRAARSMSRAWQSRVDAPVPLVELHLTDATMEPTDEEADELVRKWEEARRRGGTALTPAAIDLRVHGDTPHELFVEGRNASRLDVANYLALPAALLEGSLATASLTYSTQEGQRNELVDLSLAYWATPIEARLSMDDVTARGTRIAFDLTYLASPTQPAQGPVVED